MFIHTKDFIVPFTCNFGPGQSKVFASKPGHLLLISITVYKKVYGPNENNKNAT